MIWTPSPNFGVRRGPFRPDSIVLHYTAMASAEEALERLCDPVHEVSAHYLVTQTGDIHQLVAEGARAWHAGAGAWGACSDMNSASIGIEMCNPGDAPYPPKQITAVEALVTDVMGRWGIPAERVIGHSDLAPGRKKDPGPLFPWAKLAFAGRAAWPDFEPEPADFKTLADLGDVIGALAQAGYTAPAEPAETLAAFRLRFQPQVTGPASEADLKLAKALARDFPVDQLNAYA